jgi:hypothetical protein
MKILTILITTLLVCLILLYISNSYDASDYRGDGVLVDNGSDSAKDRYILNLGNINLRHEGDYSLLVENLPAEDFILGFAVVFTENVDSNIFKTSQTEISVKICDSNKLNCTSHKGQLSNWTMSTGLHRTKHGFLYSRNMPHFQPKRKNKYSIII